MNMGNDLVVQKEWYAAVPRNSRGFSLFGYSVLIFAVFGFGAWAGFAPIDGAIISRGSFVVTGENKIIQHFEGGIIKKILVSEGQKVEVGEPLIRLDETAQKVNLRRLVLRQAKSRAMAARLRSQAAFDEQITFADDLLKHSSQDQVVKEIMSGQKLLFKAHSDKVISEIRILDRTKAAHQQSINGAQAQLTSIKIQIGLVNQEMRAKQTLLKKGLVKKSEVLAIRRARARYVGESGRLTALIGATRERMEKVNREILRERTIAVQTAVEQLQNTEADLQDLHERITEARDVLTRIDIKSPVKGIVVKLRYHTAGGVIEAGKDILEILPLGTELLIEAQIRPQDIDMVKHGLEAVVRMTALNQRVTPMIPGKVIYVSADKLVGEIRQSADDIYLARIRLDPQKLKELAGFKATPGMPVEVYIKTTERTFFEYMIEPIVDSMSRAFRES